MTMKKNTEPGERKGNSNSSAFLVYAVVVFSFLAVGLIVILMRSAA